MKIFSLAPRAQGDDCSVKRILKLSSQFVTAEPCTAIGVVKIEEKIRHYNTMISYTFLYGLAIPPNLIIVYIL